MFKHILCPTEFEERTNMADKKAVQLSHQFDSKITLLNVHEAFMDKQEREMLRISVSKMKNQYKRIAIEPACERIPRSLLRG